MSLPNLCNIHVWLMMEIKTKTYLLLTVHYLECFSHGLLYLLLLFFVGGGSSISTEAQKDISLC